MTYEEAIGIINSPEYGKIICEAIPCTYKNTGCGDCGIAKFNDLLLNALEKQIPKKPLKDGLTARKFCPSCKKPLRTFVDRESAFFEGYERVSLCPNCCEECGQKIDWGEE